MPTARHSQPNAMMYFAGIFVVSWPTMGISTSRTRPRAGKHQAGRLRRVAHQRLQKLRHHHQAAEQQHAQQEHHEVRHGEVEILEHAHVDNGRLLVPLPDHQRNEADRRDHRQRDDEVRAEPIVFLAFVEQDLQCADAQRQQRDADVVDAHAGARCER